MRWLTEVPYDHVVADFIAAGLEAAAVQSTRAAHRTSTQTAAGTATADPFWGVVALATSRTEEPE